MTREEIIRNLKYTMEKHKNDTVSTFDTNISVMCKDILDYLEQESKMEWIPVSERLPKEREWYLAVFKEKDTDFQLIPRVADYIGHGENKWRWIDEEGLPQEYLDLLECVAWMPLPEPYKGEREVSE